MIEKKLVFLIDPTISGYNQIEKKLLENITKNKGLEIEIRCLWEKETTTAIVIGVLGIAPKALKKYLANIFIDRITIEQ